MVSHERNAIGLSKALRIPPLPQQVAPSLEGRRALVEVFAELKRKHRPPLCPLL